MHRLWGSGLTGPGATFTLRSSNLNVDVPLFGGPYKDPTM